MKTFTTISVGLAALAAVLAASAASAECGMGGAVDTCAAGPTRGTPPAASPVLKDAPARTAANAVAEKEAADAKAAADKAAAEAWEADQKRARDAAWGTATTSEAAINARDTAAQEAAPARARVALDEEYVANITKSAAAFAETAKNAAAKAAAASPSTRAAAQAAADNYAYTARELAEKAAEAQNMLAHSRKEAKELQEVADKLAADQATMEAPPYEDDDPHTVPECGAAEVRKVLNEVLNTNYGVTAAVFGKKLSVSDVRTTRTDWPLNGRSCAIRLNLSLIADPKGKVIDSMNLTYTVQLNDAMDGSFVVTLDQR